jgi:hypothetical protein
LVFLRERQDRYHLLTRQAQDGPSEVALTVHERRMRQQGHMRAAEQLDYLRMLPGLPRTPVRVQIRRDSAHAQSQING